MSSLMGANQPREPTIVSITAEDEARIERKRRSGRHDHRGTDMTWHAAWIAIDGIVKAAKRATWRDAKIDLETIHWIVQLDSTHWMEWETFTDEMPAYARADMMHHEARTMTKLVIRLRQEPREGEAEERLRALGYSWLAIGQIRIGTYRGRLLEGSGEVFEPIGDVAGAEKFRRWIDETDDERESTLGETIMRRLRTAPLFEDGIAVMLMEGQTLHGVERIRKGELGRLMSCRMEEIAAWARLDEKDGIAVTRDEDYAIDTFAHLGKWRTMGETQQTAATRVDMAADQHWEENTVGWIIAQREEMSRDDDAALTQWSDEQWAQEMKRWDATDEALRFQYRRDVHSWGLNQAQCLVRSVASDQPHGYTSDEISAMELDIRRHRRETRRRLQEAGIIQRYIGDESATSNGINENPTSTTISTTATTEIGTATTTDQEATSHMHGAPQDE